MTQDKENKKSEGLSRVNSKQKTWGRIFGKRWTYPAVYLGAAALIIGLMYSKTHEISPMPKPNPSATPNSSISGGSTAPAGASQGFIWPIGDDGQTAVVTQNFFKDSANDDMKAASLVKYEDRFYTQNGIVIGLKNDHPFTVVAAASGTVTKVEPENPLMGATVTVKDDNGYETYYASLQEVEVKEGDKIVQGATIGKSGNNKFEASQKNHLHFEIRDSSGKCVDPVVNLLPPREGSVAQAPAAAQQPAAQDTGKAPDANSAASSANSAKTDPNSMGAADSGSAGSTAGSAGAGSAGTSPTNSAGAPAVH